MTFDDGPNADADVTLRVLDILRRYGDVKATFFLLGECVDEQPDLVRQIADCGHSIGNHAYTHPNLSVCTRDVVRDELFRCRASLVRTLGDRGPIGTLFRAPFGEIGGNVADVAAELGLRHVGWSASGGDWLCDTHDQTKQVRAAEICRTVSSVLDLGRPEEVVLLHDGCPSNERDRSWRTDRSQTLIALENLLEKYSKSRTFVRLE